MSYKLKPTEPPFEVVDGPFAGRKYNRKGIYAEIPPGYENRFEDSSYPAIQPSSLQADAASGGEEESHE
jgi:hypothetical protein